MRPGAAVTRAQRITPDLLQASPGAESDTRRVGPFVITPDAARKQLASVVRSAAHRDAEERLQRLTGAQLVRLVDLDIKYLSGGSGPLLSPVYVPVYIFSWMYGGSKVRTFVSGVNPAAVSGVQVLNDQAMAVTAAGVASSVLALTGLASGAALFWGGMVVPFVLGGLAARFWPRLHQAVSSVRTWWEQRQVGAAGGGGAAAGGAGGTGEGDSTGEANKGAAGRTRVDFFIMPAEGIRMMMRSCYGCKAQQQSAMLAECNAGRWSISCW